MGSALSWILGGASLLVGALLLPVNPALGARFLLLGLSSIASQLIGNPSKQATGKRSFGFNNLSNDAVEGTVIPVLYGEEKVAPRIISQNLVQEGDKQMLLVLGLLAEGECDSVYDVRLNDTPISSFPGADYIFKRGTSSQDSKWRKIVGDVVVPFTGFNQIGTPYPVGKRVGWDTDTDVREYVYEMRAQADALVVQWEWTRGLFKINDDGEVAGNKIAVWVSYRKVGSLGDYAMLRIPLTAGARKQGDWYEDKVAGEWKVRGKTTMLMTKMMRLDFGTRDAYEVKFAATGSSSQDADDGSDIRVPTLSQVFEVVDDARAYVNRALIAVRLPANEQTNGGRPKIECRLRGTKVYTAGSSFATRAWSRNPAEQLRDILTNARYGLGKRITTAKMDDASVSEVAGECDATVTPPGGAPEARHECDLFLDAKGRATDWVSYLQNVGAITLTKRDGKYVMRRDKARATVTDGHFDGRQASANGRIVRGSDGRSSLTVTQLDESQRYTGVRVAFNDRDAAYTNRTIVVTDKRITIGAVTGGPFQAGESVKGGTSKAVGRVCYSHESGEAYLAYVQDPNATAFQSGETLTGLTSGASATSSSAPYDPDPAVWLDMRAVGVTRVSEAVRVGRWLLTLAQRCGTTIQFATGWGVPHLEPLDVIEVSLDWMPWTQKKFSILAMERAGSGLCTITAREYSADLYASPFDAVPKRFAATPGGTEVTTPGSDYGSWGGDPPPIGTSDPPASPNPNPPGTGTGSPPPAPSAPPPAPPPAPSQGGTNVKVTQTQKWPSQGQTKKRK